MGIDETHERSHFLRAVLEGLAFEISLVLEGLETAGGHIHEVVVTGGGAASPAWLRILADVLDRPLVLSTTTEGAALGAAVLAASATGLVPRRLTFAAAAMVHRRHRIEPQPTTAAVDAALADGYRRLYPALRPLTDPPGANLAPAPRSKGTSPDSGGSRGR